MLLALVTMDVLGIAVTRASGFKSFHVPSTSMENTIRAGDLIVADMWYYRSHSPSRQDVILFARDNTVWVKRVIAVGGDTIEGRNGKVTINNYIIAEPFIQHTSAVAFDEMNNFDPVEVPEGKYFVMGDNRDVSLDSRPSTRGEGLGLVDRKLIVGKPLYILASTRQGKPIR
jgi:signal peptidase I